MQVIAGVSRECDPSLLSRMFVLTMTPACPDVLPSVVLYELYQVADFHLASRLIFSSNALARVQNMSGVTAFAACLDRQPLTSRERTRAPHCPPTPPRLAATSVSYSGCGSGGADSWDAGRAIWRRRCSCLGPARRRSG